LYLHVLFGRVRPRSAWLGGIQMTYNHLTLKFIRPSIEELSIIRIHLCILNILWLSLILLKLLNLCILWILNILIILIFIWIDNMAQPPPRERTLNELVASEFTYDSLCIQYPNEEVPYVLKTGLIHLLPKFHGLAGKDPYKHLK